MGTVWLEQPNTDSSSVLPLIFLNKCWASNEHLIEINASSTMPQFNEHPRR